MTLTNFLDRLTHIWETIRPFIRSKNPDPILQRTTRLIDTIVSEDWPVVRYIEEAIELGIPKTPTYHLHRDRADMVGKKYRGMLPPLPKKRRMGGRKQDFLALYEYLKAEKEKEPQFFRSSRMYIYHSSRKNVEIKLRIWMYHTEPITEDELDQEWSSAIATAILATSSDLIYSLEEGEGDELNEEVDEDETSNLNKWEGTLCFDDVCYSYESRFRRKI